MSVPSSLPRRSFLATALAAPAIARAQDSLPDRPLRIVVGFAAGGGSDVMARAIAAALEQRVGRRVMVENRPGGTGAAAGEALKHSPADGTTVAFMPTSSMVAKLFLPSYPFDPLTDLAPITTAGTFIQALAVSPRIGVTTIPEYMAWLKSEEPGRRRIGATATDAAMSLYSKLLSRSFGVPMEGMSFRGSAAMVNDLAEGRIPAAVGALTSLLVASRGGRIRLLAVSGTRRAVVAPDVPTAAEAGSSVLNLEEWYGFFARSGTAPPLIEAWNRALASALASSELAAQLSQLGLEIETSTPEQAAARLEAHLRKWQASIEQLGLKPNN
ncbi:tripartite tricarboxylate transporter substrate-binding protein [Reyranella sp.]|uniref:tripartite tricarboxylate transporter substrate-binding protein n=1 Tax=Reyranella sp. TaxID=1929291 RepID=UPI0025EDF550|nr:tripartite tricarboxylate transporter substrate-binding protein [Reyranella sp.]